MALFTKERLRNKGRTTLQKENIFSRYEIKAAERLLESRKKHYDGKKYDIFLSHCFMDADIIYGLYLELTEMGYSVYVDWIEDSYLDRKNVTRETAELLRSRMNACKSLVYASSENASHSKWMPWELGYFDGYRGAVAVLPITNMQASEVYRGQEFLSLYPFVEEYHADFKKSLSVRAKGKKIELRRWADSAKSIGIPFFS